MLMLPCHFADAYDYAFAAHIRYDARRAGAACCRFMLPRDYARCHAAAAMRCRRCLRAMLLIIAAVIAADAYASTL